MWKVYISLRIKNIWSDQFRSFIDVRNPPSTWNLKYVFWKNNLSGGIILIDDLEREIKDILWCYLFEILAIYSKAKITDLILFCDSQKEKPFLIQTSNWKRKSKLLGRKQMHDSQCCQFFKQKTIMWKVWIFLRTKSIWFDQFKPFIDAMLNRYSI